MKNILPQRGGGVIAENVFNNLSSKSLPYCRLRITQGTSITFTNSNAVYPTWNTFNLSSTGDDYFYYDGVWVRMKKSGVYLAQLFFPVRSVTKETAVALQGSDSGNSVPKYVKESDGSYYVSSHLISFEYPTNNGFTVFCRSSAGSIITWYLETWGFPKLDIVRLGNL